MNAEETLVVQRVTYKLVKVGRLIIVENVPARVCFESCEEFWGQHGEPQLTLERHLPVADWKSRNSGTLSAG